MQYFNLAKKNYYKYGLSTIQLIQIGKFYELWHEPDTPSRQQVYSQTELLIESSMRSGPLEATPPIEQVASLLDMRITSPGKRSLLQMGFPIYSLTNHLSTLLDKGWTVIVIDELVTGKSGPKQRAVSQVYSPCCNLEDCSELSYVLSIYFSQDDLLGITLFSAMNGHSIMFPVSWADRDKVARLLISYRIREIVIWANLEVGSEILINKIYNLLIGWNLFPSEPNAKIEVMGEALTNLPCYLSYRYENNNKEWLLLHIYPLVHDIRFVEDNWESPTLGAWGLGWEVWMNGMEVTQFTYFQQVGGIECFPVTGEITYGLERLAMYIQGVDNVYDLVWTEGPQGTVTYGDVFLQQEVEMSTFNFEHADIQELFHQFNFFEGESARLVELNLPLPAYEYVLKASHTFNLLDARHAISVTERQRYILRVRTLARAVAKAYFDARHKLGFPMASDEIRKDALNEISAQQLSAQEKKQ